VSIEGRISVDATFHDKSGDESLNVVSLNVSHEYNAGVVARADGTLLSVGTHTIGFEAYRNASGDLTSPSSPSRLLFVFSGYGTLKQTADNGQISMKTALTPGVPVVVVPDVAALVQVQAITTGAYTAIVYGEE